MDNQTLKTFIQEWRNYHEGRLRWHQEECCAMEILDGLENMIYVEEEKCSGTGNPK